MKHDILFLVMFALIVQFLLQKIYDLGWVHGHMKAAGNLAFVRACTETDGKVLKYNGPRWKKEDDKPEGA